MSQPPYPPQQPGQVPPMMHGAPPPTMPPGPVPMPQKKSKKVPAIIAGAVAVAVVVAGVAFALNFFRAVANPSDALPGNAAAIIKVELNPSDAKKLDIYQFLTKFPSIKERFSNQKEFTTDPRKAIWDALNTGSASGVDYDAEIKPWLGDSLGVAVVPSQTTNPGVFVAIHTIDAGKAKAFLSEKMGKDATVDQIGDFVVVTGKETASLIEKAKNEPLSKNTGYAADMAQLGEQGIVTAWANESMLEWLAKQGGGIANDVKMRGALSLTVTPSTAELRAWSTSSTKVPEGDVRDLVSGLPGDASFALAGVIEPANIEMAYDQLVSRFGQKVEQATSQMGLHLPEDLTTVLGSQVALVGDLSSLTTASSADPAALKVGIVTKGGDATKQADVWNRVKQAAAESGSSLPISFVSEGDRSAVALSPAYSATLLKPATKLGDQAAYKSVIDTSKPTTSVMYLDFNTLVPQLKSNLGEEAIRNLEVIQAFGAASHRVDGSSLSALLKLSLK